MEEELLHHDVTSLILGCCFDVMNELGSGFLENVYRNALGVALERKGAVVEVERCFEVRYQGQVVGVYKTDLIVDDKVIVELKCCKELMSEHQAQVINYLKATKKQVGLLINFGHKTIDYKRLHHPDYRTKIGKI